MSGWCWDPLAWVERDGMLESSGNGFAISRTNPGRALAVAGIVKPESCENAGWASLGVGVWSGESDFWKLSLFKAAAGAKTSHGFEFGQMRAGKWMSQGIHKCVERKVSGQWEFGRVYSMGVEIYPGGIVGIVRDNESGSELYRCRYEFRGGHEDSLPWLGALHVAQDFRGRVMSCAVRVKEPYSAESKRFTYSKTEGAEISVKGNATGFFHVEKNGGTWWAIDPEGDGIVLSGVDHVRWGGMSCEALGYSPYRRNNEQRYGTVDQWAVETVGRLKSWGFTLLGAGCDIGQLGRKGLAHTSFLGMGERLCHEDSELAISPSRHAPGTSFPNVFHPKFAALCDYWALERCAPNRDDPWLVGYFIDNELAWSGRPGGMTPYGMLQAVRAKPEGHSARVVLDAFIAKKAGGWAKYDNLSTDQKDRINREFLKIVADRYFSTTTRAIRRHDPNHMVLGCRFAGLEGMEFSVWDAAAKYCDVVSFNCYPWIDIDSGVAYTKNGGETLAECFDRYARRAGRPIMVTEWSFPALDAGRACRFGAGQRFCTQAERAKATEICVKAFLSMPHIVGYDYFMWVDEPALGITKAFPEDCNYGLVNEEGMPYELLTGVFSRIQRDSGKWRSEPPVARKTASPELQSDRGRYMSSTTKTEAGGVRFSRVGQSWRLENDAGLVLEGRLKGKPVETVSLSGRSYGSLSVLLETLDSGVFAWHEAAYTKDVSFANEGPCGVLTLTGENTGRHDIEIVQRVTLAPERKDFHYDVQYVRNAGDKPVYVNRIYIMPRASFDKPSIEDCTINVWKRPKSLYWRSADGGRYGIETTDVSAEQLQFWIGPGGGQHPDARFRPTPTRQPVELQPGARYVPSYPVGAHVVARPD